MKLEVKFQEPTLS
ncbi:hypothetical protein CcCBS67573_g05891 [Chytriomyces confervae]|uniref:Uncharacterized protein n=1 Tax=Chytriomyces confervae TaxID=246404 RepID=A0A507F826_9FUNG|nr:hypothetical protein CcCBS67573_g05891 [Chytriomyces confervae]